MIFVPGGFYLVLTYKKRMTYGKLFIALYALTSCYFSSVMTRLQLIFGPSVCLLAAIGVSWMVRKVVKAFKAHMADKDDGKLISTEAAVFLIFVTLFPIGQYICHSNHFAADSLSHPSIILAAGNVQTNNREIYDDYREAYYWLK
jgi:dolichyl-diphosphooligosaccharide--protein glycosyltransferase